MAFENVCLVKPSIRFHPQPPLHIFTDNQFNSVGFFGFSYFFFLFFSHSIRSVRWASCTHVHMDMTQWLNAAHKRVASVWMVDGGDREQKKSSNFMQWFWIQFELLIRFTPFCTSTKLQCVSIVRCTNEYCIYSNDFIFFVGRKGDIWKCLCCYVFWSKLTDLLTALQRPSKQYSQTKTTCALCVCVVCKHSFELMNSILKQSIQIGCVAMKSSDAHTIFFVFFFSIFPFHVLLLHTISVNK